MTIAVANVSLANTFGHWMARTNELAQAMSMNAVTVGGQAAVGNAVVHGVMAANTISADILKGFSSANISLQSTDLLVANTASLTTVGTLTINGRADVAAIGNLRVAGSNTTHQVVSAVDSNGTLGFIKVEFPLDQLTDVDTSNVATKNNETILKFNAAKQQWEANTLSLINSTRINTLNVGTITSVLTVTANTNLAANTFFVNAAQRRVGINTTTPDSALSVNGAILATGDISGWQTSDATFKDEIGELTGALDLLDKLRIIEFIWDDEKIKSSNYAAPTNQGVDVGVLAQEMEEVLPDLVQRRPDKTLAVNYNKLIPYLVVAVQELKKRMDG